MTANLATKNAETPAEGREPAAWLALHIFYAANPAPLLSDCVEPLIRELEDRGLIHRWFFIRYWMEGPHVRLRLRPADESCVAEVRAVTEAAITEFLRVRPAVYDVQKELLGDMYKELFLAEYTLAEWDAKYGEEGMPIRDNNSFHYYDYEPEYDRYGGPVGIELAELHFQESSEMVLRLLRTTNVHVRSMMFGASAQLMSVALATFVAGRQASIDYLRTYSSYWEATFLEPDEERKNRYDRAYDELGGSLARRVGDIFGLVLDEGPGELTAFVRDWALHYAELRRRLGELVERGALVFPRRDGSPGVAAADSMALTVQVLLSSYLHMTNNRLGLAIGDEVYLSHVLCRAMSEQLDAGSGPRL